MSAALLEKAAIALHGPDWKHEMARDLRINLRNFRRMADGELPIPPGIWPDIRRWLLAHAYICKQVAADLPADSGRTPDGLPQDMGAGEV